MLLFLLLTQALELLLSRGCFEADERLTLEVAAPGRQSNLPQSIRSAGELCRTLLHTLSKLLPLITPSKTGDKYWFLSLLHCFSYDLTLIPFVCWVCFKKKRAYLVSYQQFCAQYTPSGSAYSTSKGDIVNTKPDLLYSLGADADMFVTACQVEDYSQEALFSF